MGNDILREQVRLVFRQLPTMQISTLIVALILCFIVRNNVSGANILLWLLMISAVVISRIILHVRFLKVRESPFSGEQWAKAYLILAFFSGIIWGSSAFIIFPVYDLSYVAVFVLVIASLSASTTISHSSIRWAPAAWSAPALLLYAARSAGEGTELNYALSLLIVIYLFTTAHYSLQHNDTITEAITLKFAKMKLLDEIREANDRLSRDLDERRQGEEKLRASESKFRILFEKSLDAILLLDGNFFIECNPAAADMMGCNKPELLLAHPWELSPPVQPDGRQSAEKAMEMINIALDRGSNRFEWVHRRLNGRDFPVEVTLIPIPLYGRTILYTTWRDISERKMADEALHASEDKYRTLFEESRDMIFISDLTGRLLDVNEAGVALLGYPSRESLLMTPVRDTYADPDERDRFLAALAAEGFTKDFTTKLRRYDGQQIHVLITASAIKDSEGIISSVRGNIRDITDRLKMEEQARQTQKMESIGTLAGGIAHDFNNLLQGIFGYLSMARISIRDQDKTMDMIGQAEKALHLSVNLSSQLLTFSKGGRPVKRLISLAPLLDNAVKFALSGSPCAYRMSIEEELWPVLADEGQISQVVQNLALNADQAMPQGGTIEIRARNIEAPQQGLPSLLNKGTYVAVAVQDTGSGISEENLPKIFDPYFTTKEKGSGLGLATSYSIIKNHEGLIDLKSEQGKGTTFTIYIPAVDTCLPEQKIPEVIVESRSAKILVMDDELLVRNVAGELLQVLGHQVTTAERGEEAIELYKKAKTSGSPFEAIILDLTIRGGMGGTETLKNIIDYDPAVKAIVSSGYSDDTTRADYREQGFIASLSKPYSVEALKEVLHAIL
ncbi:MAG: hypothetical protein C0402_10990 [Thermodesulfovibrio sp.]|nr:hypothetical protein [Thermodesulfovibrio sp.]